jgi:hypothetical protein
MWGIAYHSMRVVLFLLALITAADAARCGERASGGRRCGGNGGMRETTRPARMERSHGQQARASEQQFPDLITIPQPMRRVAKTAAAGTALAGVAVTGVLVSQMWKRSRINRVEAERWHIVTVNRDQSDLTAGDRPWPLAELGDEIEVRYRTAPGDRGTEVAVRPRQAGRARPDRDRIRRVRSALRESKQVWETGEVLSPDRPGTARRTLLNRPLEYATTHGREEGRI